VPNLALRARDVEAFEDTPLEYVRAELQVSEVATPWQAAADVVKALGGALAEASAGRDGDDAWKNKDAAVYLFEAVATRSGTLAVRVLRVDCA
jgi:exportin-2 (importin alpha re-exporter)